MVAQPSKPRFRYYLYLSDAKVESFYGQIRRSPFEKLLPERISAAFSRIRVSIVRGAATPNEYEKLNAVLTALGNSEDVGSPWRPASYFKGTLSMRWDTFVVDPSSTGGGMVCFGYFRWRKPSPTKPPTMKAVILVGSVYHLIGNNTLNVGSVSTGPRNDTYRHTPTPFSMSIKEGATIIKRWLAMQQTADTANESPERVREMTSTIIEAAYTLNGPLQHLTFFAKRLHSEKVRVYLPDSRYPYPVDVDLLIGTPFYVALKE